MRRRKARVTITVDRELLKKARTAIRAGRAESLSAVFNHALAEEVAVLQRRAALDAAIADYEAEFGELTQEEMEEQLRLDRARAIHVRPRRKKAG